jgi:hypothetical protein
LSKSLDLLHRAPQVRPDDNFNWKVRLAITRERDAAARRGGVERPWLRAWNTRFVTAAAATFVVVVAAGIMTIQSISTMDAGPSFTAAPTENDPATIAEAPTTRNPLPTVSDSRFRQDRVNRVSTNPSTGNASDQSSGLIVEDPQGPPTQTEMLTNRVLYLRARQLEEQVKVLQHELRSCKDVGDNQ